MLDNELSTVGAVPPTLTSAERFACGFHAEGRGAAWVSVGGELDLATAPEFKQTLEEALEHALLVIIDLRALTFIDSTGLHAIIDADARTRGSDHRLVFIRGRGQVDRLFTLVGVSARLRIVDLAPGPSVAEVIRKSRASGAA